MKSLIACLLVLVAAASVRAYPLDGYESTRINRLRAYDLARDWMLSRGSLVPGSLWTMDQVQLRLPQRGDFAFPNADAEFTALVRELVGADARHYGIAVLDLSDPERPRYADLNADVIQNPGSVGKIVVALAWFQVLAERFPEPEARARFLRETRLTANAFVAGDHHVVPVW